MSADIDKVVKLFWQSFPDRASAARVLAAIAVISRKIGPEQTISLVRRMSVAVDRNETNSIISFEREGFHACIVGQAPPDMEERTPALILEYLMDHLVAELRDQKRAAPSGST